MYDTKPEIIGIFNNGVTGSGGSGSSGGSAHPDGSGGLVIDVPTGAWTSIIDLGSASSATLFAGKAYKLTVPSSCTLAANVMSGYLGPDAYLTMVIADGATVTVVPPLHLHDTPTAGATNDCLITFRGDNAYLYVDNVTSNGE